MWGYMESMTNHFEMKCANLQYYRVVDSELLDLTLS